MRYTSATDIPEAAAETEESPSRVDASPFVGMWSNTNEEPRKRIAAVRLKLRDGTLIVNASGNIEHELCDWGEVEADVFAPDIGSHTAMSFQAIYDFGFLESYLHANIKHGTLVIATCNKFKDGSGRSNYYTREFFYQLEG
ncbi:MAG: hypothetical protein QOJ70_3462 [Acidobacteriota bacterium]|jgi:hypothetical protein|nr:hypothetical protein [Acidobacteriota bacterium]